jgi:hypothetical protein
MEGSTSGISTEHRGRTVALPGRDLSNGDISTIDIPPQLLRCFASGRIAGLTESREPPVRGDRLDPNLSQ